MVNVLVINSINKILVLGFIKDITITYHEPFLNLNIPTKLLSKLI